MYFGLDFEQHFRTDADSRLGQPAQVTGVRVMATVQLLILFFRTGASGDSEPNTDYSGQPFSLLSTALAASCPNSPYCTSNDCIIASNSARSGLKLDGLCALSCPSISLT